MNYNFKNSLLENNNFEILNNYEIVNNNKSLMVSKKIESYFNDLVKIPEAVQTGGKNDFSFTKFYNEYIEHNLLLLFIILCLVIFLIVKYINKNYYTDTEKKNEYKENFNYKSPKNKSKVIKQNSNNFNNDKNYDDEYFDDEYHDDDYYNNEDFDDNEVVDDNYHKLLQIKKLKKIKREKIMKIKKENEKKKHLLELEKQSILDIIDELSKINYEKIENNNKVINQQKYNNDLNNDSNSDLNYMYIDRNYINDNETQLSNYSLVNSDNYDYNDNYYSVNKNINYKDKKSPNYVKGIYIESPFEQ